MKRYVSLFASEFVIPAKAGIHGGSIRHPWQTINKIVTHFANDSLYRNSIYLMLSTGITSVFGFFFWIITAKLYTTDQIGLATALISVTTLINSFSILGLNVGLIRYLPKSNKRNEKINSSFILVTLSSIIAGLIFIANINIFSPQLHFIKDNIFTLLIFLLALVGLTISTLIESIFSAYKAAKNIVIKNSVMSVIKIILPLVFVALGAFGIFAAVVIGIGISVIISIWLLITKYDYKPSLAFNKDVIKEMAAFSGGNYIAHFLAQAPMLILPVVIINQINAETAAYYYISTMILGFIIIIPSAATQTLLAEGSYNNESLRAYYSKSAKIIFLLLLPTILMVLLFGQLVLNAFGSEYVNNAFHFLQIISVSSIFMAISLLANSILKIRHQITELIIVNFLGVISILGLSYLFASWGLVGIGWAWLVGQAILSGLYLFYLSKNK